MPAGDRSPVFHEDAHEGFKFHDLSNSSPCHNWANVIQCLLYLAEVSELVVFHTIQGVSELIKIIHFKV